MRRVKTAGVPRVSRVTDEKVAHPSVGRQFVFAFRESVAFVVENEILHLEAAAAEAFDDLIGFGLDDPRVP